MTTAQPRPLQTIAYGAGAGVLASLAMAMYAMIAAWEKGTGFFTPLFHIASLWASQDSMTASMKDAMTGNDFHFVLGTAVLGAMIHMMTGAMFGAGFAVIVSRLDLGTAATAGLGIAYGALVFAVTAFAGLPLAASVFGSGDPITNMAEMAGWGVFLVEHLVFGLTLGLLVRTFASRTRTSRTDLSAATAR